ncbi:MAG TPA: enoyl-CoA hydratase-related protein [Candidatus Dormibacteraeota bacterium]|nr:enoyl-CoA hydratase-related protein [Candidatus Dormibacteraeota bacterium]
MTERSLPTYTTILLERDQSLTWLTLNRPERLNAMNATLLEEFSDALDVLAADEETRVIAIRGAGRAFSSGYDIERDESAVAEGHDIVDDYVAHAAHLSRFMRIWDHPKPILACVHGYCLAGATQMCVFCDITVVSDDAVIGLPSIPLGGGYITPLWVPLVGPKRAKQMSFVAGSKISGRTASEWGWANYSVPAEELEDNVRRLAWDIAKIPASTLRMKKMSINRAAEVMGFRTIVPMGAETDALLHSSAAVQELFASIRAHGLKEAIARFHAGGSQGGSEGAC